MFYIRRSYARVAGIGGSVFSPSKIHSMKTYENPRSKSVCCAGVAGDLNHQFSTLNLLAQGTAFSYQGRLNDGTNPANGTYDLTFTIFGGFTGGFSVAGPSTNSAIGVSNGLFSVTLDFGNSPFSAGAALVGNRRAHQWRGRFHPAEPATEIPRDTLRDHGWQFHRHRGQRATGEQFHHGKRRHGSGRRWRGGAGRLNHLNNAGVLSVTGNSDITAATVSGAVRWATRPPAPILPALSSSVTRVETFPPRASRWTTI